MRRAFSGNPSSIPEAPLRFLTPLSRESLQLPSASSPAIQQQAIFTAAQLAAKVRVCLDCATAPPQSGSHLAAVARGAWRRPAGSTTSPRVPAGPGALTFSAGSERPAPRPQRASEPTPDSAFGSGRRPPPPGPRCRVPALARHTPCSGSANQIPGVGRGRGQGFQPAEPKSASNVRGRSGRSMGRYARQRGAGRVGLPSCCTDWFSARDRFPTPSFPFCPPRPANHTLAAHPSGDRALAELEDAPEEGGGRRWGCCAFCCLSRAPCC